MDLVAGATGMLGSRVCRRLSEAGREVRALVRSTSDPDKVDRLRKLDAEVVVGDLKDRDSLAAACQDADVVVSTVSSTLSRQAGDTIESVDLEGQLSLVEAAEAAGVDQFVFISFPEADYDSPLQSAKRAVEQRLRAAGRMAHTSLQPVNFIEVWLGPALGFDVANARARVFGSGENPISWISLEDVARFAVAAIQQPEARNRRLPLGGPEALSHLQVIRLLEQLSGRSFEVERVPETELETQWATAQDSLDKSYAALMLQCARGWVADAAESRRILPIETTSTRDHLASIANR